MKSLVFILAALALVVSPATAQTKSKAAAKKAATPPAYAAAVPKPTLTEVRYGPHERHVLDFWKAESAGPAPLAVVIHGGGWSGGEKERVDRFVDVAALLKAGVSVVAINYRFIKHGEAEGITPPVKAPLHDAARALQFVRSKAAEWNLDKTRVGAAGGSAGACSSLWLAFHDDLADPRAADPVLRESSRIVAAGALNTQATMNLLRWPDFLGASRPEWTRPGEVPTFYGATTDAELSTPKFKAILDDVDMLALVSRDDPPVFLFSAQPDGPLSNRGHLLHHPNHAREVKKACDAAGVPATAWFGMTEPRLEGDPQRALREFLFNHLAVKAPAR